MTNYADSSNKAVLWDLDGTLVDTNYHHWTAWQAETRLRNRPITWDDFTNTYGQRNDTIIRLWFSPALSQQESNSIGEAKEARFRELVRQKGLVLLPGVQNWLESFRQMGIHQALATMTPQNNIEVIFTAIPVQPYFQVIVTGDQVKKGKPDPDIFLEAARRLNILPERCIVIEDSAAGVEAARRAGMLSIGVNESMNLPADCYVPSLAVLTVEQVQKLLA